MKEVTHRKDAARTLHRAHENDCPSKLSTRRRKFTKNVGVDAEQEQQEKKEKEEEVCGCIIPSIVVTLFSMRLSPFFLAK